MDARAVARRSGLGGSARLSAGQVGAVVAAIHRVPAADGGHFSMLIAQLGHITEMAATDWLHPNPRSPRRADAAAWIGQVLGEPHSRELLGTLLQAAGGSEARR